MASTHRRILALAGLPWIEARRTRLPWIAAALAVVVLLAGLFAESLSVVEGPRMRVALLGAGSRLAAMFVICMHTAASMLREQQDKGTDLLLSLDIPRLGYLGGKAMGYMGVAAAICVVFWLPLAPFAPPAASAIWLASLVLEGWLVVSATLFCTLTFTQLTVAATFVFALYLLGRTSSAIVLIATASPFIEPTWTHQGFAWLVQGLALLLPDLDRWTRTAWLLGHGPTALEFLRVAVEALVYSALLLVAAAVDLQRKNL